LEAELFNGCANNFHIKKLRFRVVAKKIYKNIWTNCSWILGGHENLDPPFSRPAENPTGLLSGPKHAFSEHLCNHFVFVFVFILYLLFTVMLYNFFIQQKVEEKVFNFHTSMGMSG